MVTITNTDDSRNLQFKDLVADTEIVGPCIIWGSPKGDIFVAHDDTTQVLDLHEKMMLRIGALTIDALDQKYNSEPQRG